MKRRFFHVALLALFTLAGVGLTGGRSDARETIDRAFVIMMENQGFDNVIGHNDPNGVADTPFITGLAERYGLSTLSFGVTHPSLPNYLSAIAGTYFGVQDDNASCYATGGATTGCHGFNAKNLIDSLEAKGISWEAFMQGAPTTGYLGVQYPAAPGPAIYAQKHNPFVYFSDIALNASRLAHIVPLASVGALSSALANPRTAPQFVWISPDQCHDMHSTPACPSGDALLKAGDAYVQSLVTAIVNSPSFTRESAIFLTWDENDYSSNLGCCDSLPNNGGGHIATILIGKEYGRPLTSSRPYNEYSILSTFERAWRLPLLGATADTAHVVPMFDLLP